MKIRRRRFFKAIAAAPAAPALLGQQVPTQNNAPQPASAAPPATSGYPTLEISVHDAVGDMQPKFFSAAHFATLRKLSDILMPAIGEAPGALQAGAPEFLDFLISRSPGDRQELYRTGLDGLASQSKKRFGKEFAALDDESIATLLAPLKQPWTYDPPSDPVAQFLRAAKQDVRTATLNSREYALAATSAGGRRGAGLGLYWYPLD